MRWLTEDLYNYFHLFLGDYYFTDMAITFYNLSSEDGIKKLDEYLLSRSYISG